MFFTSIDTLYLPWAPAGRYEYQAREVDSLFPICRYTAEIMQSTLELANQAELRNMLEMQRQNSIYFEAVEEVERGEK